MTEPEKNPLNRKEAARYLTERGLKTAPATLAKYASLRIGPHFEHFGRWPVYYREELDAWLESLRKPAEGIQRRYRGLSMNMPIPENLYQGK